MATKKHELTKDFKFNIGEESIIVRIKMAFVKVAEKWGAVRDSYSVVIEYGDDFITSKYYKSVIDFNNGNRKVDKEDLANALYCICTDAMAYREHQDYDEFHDNFGGNYKTHSACRKTYEDLFALFGSDDMIMAIGNKADEGDFEIVKVDDEK